MTDARIGRWIRAGRLLRVQPAVYAIAPGLLTERGRLAAALLYAGPGAALSHAAGAWWLELLRIRPATIDVCAPGRMRSLPGVIVHHPRAVERIVHEELPVVALPTLILQIAGSLSFAAVRRALAQAEFRGLLKIDVMWKATGQGREGSDVLRRALASHLPQLARTQNDFEAEFLFLCERFGLPMPEVNVRVGPYRPDMLWRDLRLIVELDGRDAHTKPAQVARDHERDLRLRSMGFAVVRYTWAQVHLRAETVAADLAAQMARAT